MDKTNDPRLEKVYIEAGQWIRLCNQIIWGVGSLFAPTSFAALWFSLSLGTFPQMTAIASLSICLFAVWMIIFRIYRNSAKVAREALSSIECAWDLDNRMRFYNNQEKYFMVKLPW